VSRRIASPLIDEQLLLEFDLTGSLVDADTHAHGAASEASSASHALLAGRAWGVALEEAQQVRSGIDERHLAARTVWLEPGVEERVVGGV
jgi:hypothetical protein